MECDTALQGFPNVCVPNHGFLTGADIGLGLSEKDDTHITGSAVTDNANAVTAAFHTFRMEGHIHVHITGQSIHAILSEANGTFHGDMPGRGYIHLVHIIVVTAELDPHKVTFTPRLDSVGMHSGTVTITCEDAYGNPFSQTLDVDLTVDEPLPETGTEQEEEEKKISKGTIILIILCVLLTAGIVLQGIILWGKIHKLEEDRL